MILKVCVKVINVIKKALPLVSIALISSFIYSVFGTLYTQIINGVFFEFSWFLELFPRYFSSVLPYFLLGWVPLSVLIEKVSRINGYFVKIIIYCSVGFISFFIFEALWNLGNINFFPLLTYSLTFGVTTAFVFYNSLLLYKAVYHRELKSNKKRFITLFIFALAVLSINFIITGDHSNQRFEEYHSIEELQKNSPLSFKLPSYLPEGAYFNYAQLYQDRNEVTITIAYSANDSESKLVLWVTDKSTKKELTERHDNLEAISINENKGFIGRSVIVGNYEYTDVTLMWGENEIYYTLLSDVHENSIFNEDELLKVAKSFK
jgi:hypothetical protein